MSMTTPVAVQPVPRGRMVRLVGRRLQDWVPAAVVLVVVVGGWQEAYRAFAIKQFLLPKPSSIASTFWANHSELLRAGWLTFQEAFGGFAVGSALAVLVAIALARWRPVGRALMPYAIAAKFALPVHFIGVGEGIDDLAPFSAKDFAQAIAGIE